MQRANRTPTHPPRSRRRPRVAPLELFFDSGFVLALTQVTAFMADELSWQGILRGALVIMLLWWAWTGLRVAGQCG